MKFDLSGQAPAWGRWIVVPLRLFLGVTFIYAGAQKLTDPQYFNPAARGFIGKQISDFAMGSPLRLFLIRIAVPHAVLFGSLVAYGELAIGLGVLFGLLLRPAALAGLLINLVFFLSADWHVYPYFYGSDLVFCFCWLTLLLAGSGFQALPTLDVGLARWLVKRASPNYRALLAGCCVWLLGVSLTAKVGEAATAPTREKQRQPTQSSSQFRTWQLEELRKESRRNFVLGILLGGGLMLILSLGTQVLRTLAGDANEGNGGNNGTGNENGNTTGDEATPTPGDLTPSGSVAGGTAGSDVIAQISAVPENSSTTFTLPSNGDPGILIHLKDGAFVAFDATCTHAGCPVDYDPSSGQLVCPCHGAAFDPTHNAAVLNGPAQTPLTSVKINVNQSAGTITLG